ncbi:MAG TPA: hypothetical protein VGP07_05860 [Polyangia bacterium]|jgi:high-affinity Fe2+/Pb2+ permease
MFENVVVTQRFGVSWTMARCSAIVGAGLMVLAALLFWALFKHSKGTVRRLAPEEAGRVALYGRGAQAPGPEEVIKGVGVGAGVELNANIDGLRKAARRGDWTTFWLWPLLLSSACIGVWFMFTAILLAASAPGLIEGVLSLLILLMLFVAWFMPWAAVHTNIDSNVGKPKRETTAAKP